jgi:hypothetical protein
MVVGGEAVYVGDASTAERREGESPAWFLPDGTAVLTASGPGSAALCDRRDPVARPRIQRDPSGLEIAWDLGASSSRQR